MIGVTPRESSHRPAIRKDGHGQQKDADLSRGVHRLHRAVEEQESRIEAPVQPKSVADLMIGEDPRRSLQRRQPACLIRIVFVQYIPKIIVGCWMSHGMHSDAGNRKPGADHRMRPRRAAAPHSSTTMSQREVQGHDHSDAA